MTKVGERTKLEHLIVFFLLLLLYALYYLLNTFCNTFSKKLLFENIIFLENVLQNFKYVIILQSATNLFQYIAFAEASWPYISAKKYFAKHDNSLKDEAKYSQSMLYMRPLAGKQLFPNKVNIFGFYCFCLFLKRSMYRVYWHNALDGVEIR